MKYIIHRGMCMVGSMSVCPTTVTLLTIAVSTYWSSAGHKAIVAI